LRRMSPQSLLLTLSLVLPLVLLCALMIGPVVISPGKLLDVISGIIELSDTNLLSQARLITARPARRLNRALPGKLWDSYARTIS
jgi:hypothetical protein